MDNTENPGTAVVVAVEESLAIAASWLHWDGTPRVSEDDRVFTPHKAVRRIGDHLVDHLAEMEALLAGVPTQPDGWYASLVTTAADWAPFTEVDLVEAGQRLRRLARTLEHRLEAAGPDAWDSPRAPSWTLREIAEHLVEVRWYAEQVGRLS